MLWAALLGAVLGAGAEENAKPAGKRLRLQVQETRLRGDVASASRTSSLLLHADAGSAFLFVGTQLAITQNERETATTTFKNAGVTLRVSAVALPDGRFHLEAEYEESQKRGLAVERAPGPVTGLTLREGESVRFASAVDPVTGEVVRVELMLAAAPPAKPVPAASGAAGRLRAELVLTRRQGQMIQARRPYAILLQDGSGDEATKTEVFSGSQLPVQTRRGDNQIVVMLKDVGAGLTLEPKRLEDGRYRLGVRFSDGVLSPGEGAPELRVFQSESVLVMREGETLMLASSVDPQTGDVVEAELTLDGLK